MVQINWKEKDITRSRLSVNPIRPNLESLIVQTFHLSDVVLTRVQKPTSEAKLWRYGTALILMFREEHCRRGSSYVRASEEAMADALMSYAALRQLSQFAAAVAFFHTSEYALAASFHGRFNVTLSSLLISKHYVSAMMCALVEYIIEILLFPGSKERWWVSNIGLVMVLIGEIIRKTAIITAGRSFTHIIRRYHEDHHELITHGIYSFIRHPSYCGFFIWATGTQVMLCNPICIIAFTIVTWKFFANRIPYEEFFLRQFFGSQYEEYARRVPSGLPLIK